MPNILISFPSQVFLVKQGNNKTVVINESDDLLLVFGNIGYVIFYQKHKKENWDGIESGKPDISKINGWSNFSYNLLDQPKKEIPFVKSISQSNRIQFWISTSKDGIKFYYGWNDIAFGSSVRNETWPGQLLWDDKYFSSGTYNAGINDEGI